MRHPDLPDTGLPQPGQAHEQLITRHGRIVFGQPVRWHTDNHATERAVKGDGASGPVSQYGPGSGPVSTALDRARSVPALEVSALLENVRTSRGWAEADAAAPAPSTRVLIVGLGTAAQAHLTVLERMPEADVIAGVDPNAPDLLTFRGTQRPVYKTVGEASQEHDPAVVVIATPTATHAVVCDQVCVGFPSARLLVEKPAGADLDDAVHVVADIGKGQPVDVAYHMSFSPEVTWGLDAVSARTASLGQLTWAEMFFADAYFDDYGHAQASLGTSWIDSGINALSVLNRFAAIRQRRSLRQIGASRESVFEAQLTCHAGGREFEAVLVTSWHVGEPAKTTRLTWSSGTELLMDHTAVAGYLLQDGVIADVFGSDRSISRRERRYRALYQHWLAEGRPIMPAAVSLNLHQILLGPLPRPSATTGP